MRLHVKARMYPYDNNEKKRPKLLDNKKTKNNTKPRKILTDPITFTHKYAAPNSRFQPLAVGRGPSRHTRAPRYLLSKAPIAP